MACIELWPSFHLHWTLTLPSTYFDSCYWYIIKKAVHIIVKHHHDAKKKFKALFTSKSAARDSLSSSSLGTSSPRISLSWLIHKWSCSWSSTNGLGTSSEESESVSDVFTALCDKGDKDIVKWLDSITFARFDTRGEA